MGSITPPIMVSNIETTKNKLNIILIKEGQLIYCVDTKELFYDTNDKQRIQIGDLIFVNTDDDLPILTALSGKLYYVASTNALKRYTGSEWVILNASSILASITNDGLMSKEDKIKLDGIESGANKFTYTHPENHPASIITTNATARFVTDAQITAWNAKASTALVTSSANGLMSAVDKIKLDGIAANANNYTHPNDANIRHVTDAQINAWNAKEPAFTKHTAFNRNFGNVVGTVCQGNDPRLYDSRRGTLLETPDTRIDNNTPEWYMKTYPRTVYAEFKQSSIMGITNANHVHVMLITMTPWTDSSGGLPQQLAIGNGGIHFRTGISNIEWGQWYKMFSNGEVYGAIWN